MGTVIFILVMVITVIVGKSIITENQRAKSQKKFMKNMNKHK